MMAAALLDIIFAGGGAGKETADAGREVVASLYFVPQGGGIAPLVRRTPSGPRLVTEPELAMPAPPPEISVTVSRAQEASVQAHLLGTGLQPDGGEVEGIMAVGLHQLGPQLPPHEAALAARAAALLNWHRRARHCPICGAPTVLGENGVARRCVAEGCGQEHFPRLDLVVMTLPVDGDWCLLGRQPRFPEGFYSGFAGFAEPGETLEQAARRETLEEANVSLTALDYRFSQPWPFPHAVTVGFIGHVADREAARADDAEIAEVRWFRRAEIGEMLDRAEQNGQLRMPGAISLAHQLARDWLARSSATPNQR
ncbi:NAD+ diphosphatase [Breoghania corrubedonensis]|uniref:NAD(+) diphosphatase n=1 Tax=Breoghania corrubedonensis TaxID=665038 RepID=A0A2T5VE44_9HYPH|nr:NAD(+) diphosphatase [Breoghania corrubedonensis]PTW62027.1 NAD+ diphosphatase [Breoghania corrubedonensis]